MNFASLSAGVRSHTVVRWMTCVSTLIAVVLCCAAADTPSPKTDGKGFTLHGQVTSDGNPVSNAFFALDGPIKQVTLSDADGYYHFPDLPPGDYRIVPLLEGFDFIPSSVEIEGLNTHEEIPFLAIKRKTPKPLVSADKPSGTRIELNQRMYGLDDEIHAVLTLSYDSEAPELYAQVVSTFTGDVELITLKRDQESSRMFRTQTGLFMVQDSANIHDTQLSVLPGDRVAVLFHTEQDISQTESDEQVVGDFALIEDLDFTGSPVYLDPEIAASADELNPHPAGKRLGTLLARNGWPIQIPIDEVVFFPRDKDDTKRFIEATNGEIVATQEDSEAGGAPTHLIRFTPPKTTPMALSQLRDLLDQKEEVYVSNLEVLDLWARILELRLQGFIVAANPRLQFHEVPGPLPTESGAADTRSRTMLNEGPLNVPKLWAFMALWDRDTVRIPAAILDVGFAPSPDLRTPFIECDMEADGPGGMLCGPGMAFGFQRVGNSLFGGRSWHGTGVASTLAGKLNNRWTPSDGQIGGRAGVGGQVVQPMLYQYGLGSYVFEFGAGMRKAALDGASVINISGGYPCRIVDNLGIGFNICSPGGRAALCGTATAVLAGASAVICATAGLTAAIPIVGPFLAIPLFIACGTATAATIAASAACFASLALGDPRDPMIEGVRFATERGIPIVAAAGNRLSEDALPPVVRDLINFNEIRIEEWQVFPAMIEPCIAAAATEDRWPFANSHFTGDRINVWAPIRSPYYRPPSDDTITPPSSWILAEVGGTSGAAPYAAGTIAAMQAVNPFLNPRTPGLSDAQRRDIPNRIRTLLANTAWTTDELIAMAPADQTNAVAAGAALRRHLINPFRAVQTAALGILPDFAALGYDTRLNFNEVNPAEAADDIANARPLTLGGVQTETIINILGEDGAPDRADVDWWRFTIPPTHPLAIATVELVYPRGYGDLTIDGLTLVNSENLGIETRLTFETHRIFAGTDVRFVVRGVGRDDNVYKIALVDVRSGGLAPAPDVFDRNDLGNPVRPNNNIAGRAVPLGTSPELEWVDSPARALDAGLEIKLQKLTFHDPLDSDWFRIDALPALEGCYPYLEIEFGPGVRCTVIAETRRSKSEVIARSAASILTIPNSVLPALPIFVHFQNLDPSRPLTYTATFIYRTLPPDLCAIAELANQSGASQGRNIFQSGFYSFPAPAPDSGTIDASDFLLLPPRQSDPFGRVINPEWNLFEWRGGGDFRAELEIPGNASLRVRLLDLDGIILTETATPDLEDGKAGPPDDFPGNRLLTIFYPALPPGTYVIEYSQGTLGILIGLKLPRNAVRDGSPGLEDLGAGPMPTPPPITALQESGSDTAPMILAWPAGMGFPRLQQSTVLDANLDWTTSEIPIRLIDQTFTASIPSGDGQRFFRLTTDPDGCFDAAILEPGSRPNPWSLGGIDFISTVAPDEDLQSEVLLRFEGDILGIDVNSLLTIGLSAPARSTDIGFVSQSGFVAFAAYDAAGSLVASETVAGASPMPRSVTLRSASTDIAWIDVHSPNLHTIVTGICSRYIDLLPAGGIADVCKDFRKESPGSVSNPLTESSMTLTSWLDSNEEPIADPQTRIETVSGHAGYHVAYRTEIDLARPCAAVYIDFLQLSGLVEFEAFDEAGESLDWRQITGVTGASQTVRLGFSGSRIHRVVVTAPNNLTILIRICCEGSAGKPTTPGTPDKTENCVGFDLGAGSQPNPWTVGGLIIHSRMSTGSPTESVLLTGFDDEAGIDLTGGETEIRLPVACDEVQLRILSDAGPIEIEARNAGFRIVDRILLESPGTGVASATLQGRHITHVIIRSSNTKAVLSEICVP